MSVGLRMMRNLLFFDCFIRREQRLHDLVDVMIWIAAFVERDDLELA